MKIYGFNIWFKLEVDMVEATENSENEDTKSESQAELKTGQRVIWKAQNYPGIIKWMSPNGVVAGVDFDNEIDEFAPGWLPYSTKFFEFRAGHGRILTSTELVPECNFSIDQSETVQDPTGIAFNNDNCPAHSPVAKRRRKRKGRVRVKGHVNGEVTVPDVPGINSKKSIKSIVVGESKQNGKSQKLPKILSKPSTNYEYLCGGRGIEWQNNSCYLDSTLFALFYSINIFDQAIFSNSKAELISEMSTNVQHILKYEVVYPLRRYLKCSGNNVAKLRSVLSQFNKKLIGSFMDAEDFLFILLDQALGLHEFILYSNGVRDFMHQIIIDTAEARSRRIDSVQNLLATSMKLLDDNLKFNGIPKPALLVEMPRSDGKLIGYKAIVPNLMLNINELMSSVNCICDNPATWACRQCAGRCELSGQINSRFTTFCDVAAEVHTQRHADHELVPLKEFHAINPMLLELVSVICIRDSHYVAFTKCGNEPLSPWLFLNSFLKVQPVEDLGYWLQKFEDLVSDPVAVGKLLGECPDYVSRVLLDSHICIYAKR